MSLEQLVYISLSTEPLRSPLDVADILEQSTRNNVRHGITGAFAYTDDRFVQLLEGPASALDILLQVLARDSRHRDIDILGRQAVVERAFPEWSMMFPLFTPETAAQLKDAIAARRRNPAFYRKLLMGMRIEQNRALRQSRLL